MTSVPFILDAAFVTVLVLMGLGLNHWFKNRDKRKQKKILKGGFEHDDGES